MDIIHLRSTRQVLTEASYKFHKFLNDGTRMFYGRQRATVPGVIFKPADGNSIMNSGHIFSVVVNNAAGTKMWNKIIADNPGGTVTQGSIEHEFLQLWANLNNSTQDSVDLRAMSEFPKIFKITELYGRERMFKFITTDLRMNPLMFEQVFGDIPELGEEDYVKFHDARVFIPDNARAANKKSMMDILETLHQHLKANGFGFLFHGDIRFIRISGNAIGLYGITTKTMVIQPTVKKSKSVIFTLLHEFSHKYWFEYMDQEARDKVKKQYWDLMRAGVVYNKDTSLQDASKAEVLASIEPGMTVVYKGRKRGFKDYSPYVIKSITDDGKLKIASANSNTDFVRADVPVSLLITTNRWEMPELNIEKQEPPSKYDMTSDQWFPTQYSMESDEEWFAEMMAFYLLDHLSGEPEEFMHEVFGV